MYIHDNILVYGKSPEEHEANLKACLQRLRDKGLTLRRSKCTFAASSVSWLGYIFSKSGMSADPKKVAAILQAGRPETTEEVKSFISLPVQCQIHIWIRTGIRTSHKTTARASYQKQEVSLEWSIRWCISWNHQHHDKRFGLMSFWSIQENRDGYRRRTTRDSSQYISREWLIHLGTHWPRQP